MTETLHRTENQWDGIDVHNGDWIARWTREDGNFNVYMISPRGLEWQASFSNPNHGFDLTWKHALEELSA